MSSKRIKEIVKNAELAKGTNADPSQLGQYSATNQVSEDGSLNQYLSSRGINPKFVSRETKISHAKSSTFQKWKNDHKLEEVETEEPLVEDALLDKFLSSRGINPKYVTKNMKVAHAKSGEFIKWKNDHHFEQVTPSPTLQRQKELKKRSKTLSNIGDTHNEYHINEETDEKDMVCFDIPLLIRVLEYTREDMKTDIELHNMVERLINMRDNVPLDMTHYDDITSKLVKENHIAIAMGKMLDDEGGMVLSQLEQIERAVRMVRSYIGKDYEKQLPAWVQAKITIASDYIDTVGTYLISKNEKVNEETKPTALDKFRKASAEREAKHKEIEKNQSKNGSGMTSAIDRLEKHMNKEDVYQDPQAATQTVFDNGTSTNDAQEKMSKSARMIKALYKKLNMKEDTYDWEKDDKNQTSSGKSTKEPKEKPDARAILTGGKTMTGDTRDTLEIDPMMKNRPDLNGTVKDNDNTKKNNKINN